MLRKQTFALEKSKATTAFENRLMGYNPAAEGSPVCAARNTKGRFMAVPCVCQAIVPFSGAPEAWGPGGAGRKRWEYRAGALTERHIPRCILETHGTLASRRWTNSS